MIKELTDSDDAEFKVVIKESYPFGVDHLRAYVQDKNSGIRTEGNYVNIGQDVQTQEQLLPAVQQQVSIEAYGNLVRYVDNLDQYKRKSYYPPYGYRHGHFDGYLMQRLGYSMTHEGVVLEKMTAASIAVVNTMINSGFLQIDWSELKGILDRNALDYSYSVEKRMAEIMTRFKIQHLVLGCGRFQRHGDDELFRPQELGKSYYGLCGSCSVAHETLEDAGVLTVSIDPLEEADIIADVTSEAFWHNISNGSLESVMDETWLYSAEASARFLSKVHQALKQGGKYWVSPSYGVKREEYQQFMNDYGFQSINNETRTHGRVTYWIYTKT